jgi:hypothetical protein
MNTHPNQPATSVPATSASVASRSAANSQRRAEMLAQLQQAARENSRWRRNRRRAVLLAPVIALLAGAGLWWAARDPARNETAVASDEEPTAGRILPVEPEALADVRVAVPEVAGPYPAEVMNSQSLSAVATDHRPAGILVNRIDDDQLLEMLSAIGRPAGLARINGRTELVAMENPPADGP